MWGLDPDIKITINYSLGLDTNTIGPGQAGGLGGGGGGVARVKVV